MVWPIHPMLRHQSRPVTPPTPEPPWPNPTVWQGVTGQWLRDPCGSMRLSAVGAAVWAEPRKGQAAA